MKKRLRVLRRKWKNREIGKFAYWLRVHRIAYKPGGHVAWLTEEQEEMVDLMICCMTELWNQGVDVEKALNDKILLNKKRADRCLKET